VDSIDLPVSVTNSTLTLTLSESSVTLNTGGSVVRGEFRVTSNAPYITFSSGNSWNLKNTSYSNKSLPYAIKNIYIDSAGVLYFANSTLPSQCEINASKDDLEKLPATIIFTDTITITATESISVVPGQPAEYQP
jgi:hypothetical protein